MTSQTYQEKPISLGKAAKKYGVPQPTLTRWVKAGRLKVLKWPEKKGQALLVDEASVAFARLEAQKYTNPEDYPPMESPLSPPNSEHRTADLVDKYNHYGETVGFKPTTMEKNRQTLRVFTEKCPTLPTTAEPIMAFIHDLKVGMTRKKTYYQVIRAFYNYLVDFHNIQTPLNKRMVPRADKHPYFRVLSREKVAELFNASETFQERMIFKVLYATRIRVGELVSLTSDSLFPDHIEVTGKTGRWEIPISADLYNELCLLGEGSLFRDRDGKPMARDGVRHRLEKCLKKIGVTGKKLGPHTLRHTSLTHLYEDSNDIPLVQEAAHHADIQTTMIYTHPRAVKQQKKLMDHDPLKKLAAQARPAPEPVPQAARCTKCSDRGDGKCHFCGLPIQEPENDQKGAELEVPGEA